MRSDHLGRNDSSLADLRALVARMGKGYFARGVGTDWTVAMTLVHLAFWERLIMVRWAKYRESLTSAMVLDADVINGAALEEWKLTSGPVAARRALAAAEEATRYIAGLPEEAVEAAMHAQMMRMIDRSIHRREHIAQIERALPRPNG